MTSWVTLSRASPRNPLRSPAATQRGERLARPGVGASPSGHERAGEARDALGERRLQHPTDSHPPLALRLEGLGVPLAGVRDAALQVSPAEPAATLVADCARIERELTEVEHYLLARQLGLAPAADAGAGGTTPAGALPSGTDAG